MDTRIYVMTHKKMTKISDQMYIPLHVGKSGKEALGYLGDDTGNHISEKNANYCELTGMYWLWKNINCDIIGICHYRRFLIKNEQLLKKQEIEEWLQKYDIIIPNSCYIEGEDIYRKYCKDHKGKDLDLCREVISEKYPEYISAFDYVMKISVMSIGNMWITRKNIFDSYCEWLFDILFEVEKRIDMTGYDRYQKRVMGFLSERLFRVWLVMQSVKIKEVKLKEIEMFDFGNLDRKNGLLYRCIKLKLDPILQMYRRGQGGMLLTPFSCKEDFQGKIPVWIYSQQEEANTSDLMSLYIEGVQRNFPKEKIGLRRITLENCLNYVTFTEAIIRKFNEGRISMQQMSDILKAELLYRYGGLWIDTDYCVTDKIPEWSSFAPKGHKLFQFLLEAFWYYWEVEEEQIDYCLQDFIMLIAREEFPELKKEMQDFSGSIKIWKL